MLCCEGVVALCAFRSPCLLDFLVALPLYCVFLERLPVQLDPEAADFNLESLGFLVIWLDSSGEVVSSQGTSSTKDVVTIGGTEVWWPW